MIAAPPSLLIHLLKIGAALVIVGHHLSDYGPLAQWIHQVADPLARLAVDYGAMAVQVFLVLGGYLAVRGLQRQAPQGLRAFPGLAVRRYLRLVPATIAAVLLAVVANEMARHAGEIPGLTESPPSLAQAASHVFMLQDVLGYSALSAGVWYVAIDLQLYLLLALVWCVTPMRHVAWLLSLLALLSLLWFNREPSWSVWAPYFLVSYGLGGIVALCQSGQAGRWLPVSLMLACMMGAVLDDRARLLVATATALLLWWAPKPALPKGLTGCVAQLGGMTFSLFLVHYPVLLLANAAMLLGASGSLALGLFIGLASILTLFFHHQIEQPLSQS